MSTEEFTPLHKGPLRTENSRESKCDTCGSRVTMTNTMGEVGHMYGCPNRPKNLPSSPNGGSSSAYRGEGSTLPAPESASD